MEKINLLITGGCGFIASNFINYLLSKSSKYNIINIDSMYYCSDENNIIEKFRNSSSYKLIKGNICSSDLVRFILMNIIRNCLFYWRKTLDVDKTLNFANRQVIFFGKLGKIKFNAKKYISD